MNKIGVSKIDSVVVGLMNFSVIFKRTKAYKSARKDYAEYKESILNPERLKVREDIFFKNTVPLLVQQHKQFLMKGIALRFVVAISDQLPSRLVNRFDDLLLECGHIFNIVKVGEDKPHDWGEVLENEMSYVFCNHVHKDNYVVAANFRLDDDDLISKNYFSLLESYLFPQFEGFYLTFPKGFVGVYEGGNYSSFYKINRPYLAIGLSKVCLYSVEKSCFITENPVIFSTSHTQVVNDSRTILDSRSFIYIWTMHEFSDTRSVDLDDRKSRKKITDFVEHNNLMGAGLDEVRSVFDLE